jgi:capsular exopolysaccharide synthesis family protein
MTERRAHVTQSNEYLVFLRRWYWLLICSVILALVATNYALSQRVPLYQATSTVQIGRALDVENPQQDVIGITERLVPSYAERARRDPVLSAVAESLNLPLSAADLRARLLVTPVPSTQLIDISVVDSDPELAATIANEIARQLVLQSPAENTEDDAQVFLKAQLEDLRAKISNAQGVASRLQDEIAALTDASDITDAQQRLNAVEAQINSWQQSYAALVASDEPSTTNTVLIASEAVASYTPIPSSTITYYAFATVMAIGLSTLLALGLSQLNNSISQPEEISRFIDAVPVASIPRYRVPKGRLPITNILPMSPATSAYRQLRNVLHATGLTRSKVAIALTSSYRGEGKTTTSANLAITLANSGWKVILVDANLYNPELHQLFGLDLDIGLSTILSDGSSVPNALRQTDYPNLQLLTAGPIVPNYADVLTPMRFARIIEELKPQGDIILVDTPAMLQEQEAVIIARELDGVLIVAQAGRVQPVELEATLDILDRSNARTIGIVLNKVRTPRALLPRVRPARHRMLEQRMSSITDAASTRRNPMTVSGTMTTKPNPGLGNSKSSRRRDSDRSRSA